MKRAKEINGFTEFEKKVYRCVAQIPFGEVRTYKWVAGRINRPRAFRAVGNALHKNPFPLIIPCHRVIKGNGKLGGYSSGKGVKARLINLERFIKDMIE